MSIEKTKLIVILGPTASGKSDLGIKLAQKFNGEIVSADSRQVYCGMDIGTGKVNKEEQKIVAHHLLDVISPKNRFTVADFKKIADTTINNIIARNKLPFLVGGSSLYIQAIIDNYQFSDISDDLDYRNKLEKKELPELLSELKKLDQKTYERIDHKNKRRIIRALEVIKSTGIAFSDQQKKGTPKYDCLILGVEMDREELYKKIDKRVDDRIGEGMIEEVQTLLDQGVTVQRLQEFGLEYRYIVNYLEKIKEPGTDLKKEKAAMIQQLKFAIHDFARRQLIWFRREKRIKWIKNYDEAESLLKKFLNQ